MKSHSKKNAPLKILITVARLDLDYNTVDDDIVYEKKIAAILTARGHHAKIKYITKKDFDDTSALQANIQSHKPDIIFNLFEGIPSFADYEHKFAVLLENTQIPFTGNGSKTLKACLDKHSIKNILASSKIPTPQGIYASGINDIAALKLKYPLFIKPCFEDASLGIDKRSFIENSNELLDVFNKKINLFRNGLLIEEFIAGNEYSIGMVGRYPYEALAISTIDYTQVKQGLPRFLTYNSKWKTNSREFKLITPSFEASIEDGLKQEIIALASKAGKALGCHGYFRVDMRQNDNGLYVLDVNPNPDLNDSSGLAKMANQKKYTYFDLLEKIIFSSLPM